MNGWFPLGFNFSELSVEEKHKWQQIVVWKRIKKKELSFCQWSWKRFFFFYLQRFLPGNPERMVWERLGNFYLRVSRSTKEILAFDLKRKASEKVNSFAAYVASPGWRRSVGWRQTNDSYKLHFRQFRTRCRKNASYLFSIRFRYSTTFRVRRFSSPITTRSTVRSCREWTASSNNSATNRKRVVKDWSAWCTRTRPNSLPTAIWFLHN